ncbi:MAG: NAD(+) synthase [Candidatus Altiarchaeales archaeon HGW-Altiarchaeales-2]|nr:MAG: NAD(+) synthase [Candidatus Altiarchaeales archaeon HGW-Altiarchaeales-2]
MCVFACKSEYQKNFCYDANERNNTARGYRRCKRTETVVTEINPVVEKFKEILNFDEEQDKKTIGNLTARVRMCLLYAVANKNNGIVCGTGDKSEILIGYFTKYGDGACDIMPIADLYKTQVKILAKHLGVPEKITAKKPSPRLWKGQKASDEIGMDYKEIDKILVLMEKGMSKDEISEKTNISAEKVGKIFEMNKTSRHKRNLPVGFKFFLSYTTQDIYAMPSLKEYLSFVTKFLIAAGLCFELPVIMFFLAKLGAVNRRMLSAKRKYAILIIAIVAAILTPSPDAMSMIMLSIPLLALYELSIWVVYFVDKGKEK